MNFNYNVYGAILRMPSQELEKSLPKNILGSVTQELEKIPDAILGSPTQELQLANNADNRKLFRLSV